MGIALAPGGRLATINTRPSLRIFGKPETDVCGLRIARVQRQPFQIMLPRLRRIAQLLRVKIAQEQLRPRLIRIFFSSFTASVS